MTILLIDDQANILSALITGIHWHELGFTSVLTATSAAKARQLLSEHPVDIVVSDIEMPREDGLSLLSWARKNGLTYECILLTSHADFYYAKQAISLNVFDYVVQPARFEDIIQSVKKAQEKIREKKTEEKDSTRNIKAAAGSIVVNSLLSDWPDFEQSTISPQKLEQRLEQLRRFGITCTENSPCILVSVFPTLGSTDSFRQAADTFYSKICTDHGLPGLSCYDDSQNFLALFFLPASADPEVLCDALSRESAGVFSGAAVRCTTAELRFLKNALHYLYTQNTGLLSGSFRFVPFNQDAVLGSVIGQNRYLHYTTQIRNYIIDNISEPITRQDIADALHLSPDHVSFVIRNTKNMTVKELINSIKMEYARKLLKSTRIPIGEISMKCGYDNFSYFSKVYRSIYHVSPSSERGKA